VKVPFDEGLATRIVFERCKPMPFLNAQGEYKMNTDAKQQNVDINGMRKYCVVCGQELGRHVKTHCTDTSTHRRK